MSSNLRLMCVLAHPDDESLGMGGTLAHYAADGVATHVLTATRGQRGRYGRASEPPGLDVVGAAREAELRAAADVLGVADVQLLDYVDGDLDQAEPGEAIGRIVAHLRRVRPQVVITFDPYGAYGHPDHIAISQLTAAAVVSAADPAFGSDPSSVTATHRVSKLYYMAWGERKWSAYQAGLRRLRSSVDGIERQATPWPDWAITTVLDTSAVWPVVWRAVCCHKTQMSIYEQLDRLPEEDHRALWGTQEFYRVLSTVNGGRRREVDLFEGLR